MSLVYAEVTEITGKLEEGQVGMVCVVFEVQTSFSMQWRASGSCKKTGDIILRFLRMS